MSENLNNDIKTLLENNDYYNDPAKQKVDWSKVKLTKSNDSDLTPCEHYLPCGLCNLDKKKCTEHDEC